MRLGTVDFPRLYDGGNPNFEARWNRRNCLRKRYREITYGWNKDILRV
jgi:hypothetical protein